MKVCKKLYTTRLDLRPATLPEAWPVYNAPRPLVGSTTWQGDWCKGVFYAAVDPTATNAEWMKSENAKLDASELVFIAFDEVHKIQSEAILARYGEDARWFVDAPEHATTIVEQWLDAKNDEKEVPVSMD